MSRRSQNVTASVGLRSGSPGKVAPDARKVATDGNMLGKRERLRRVDIATAMVGPRLRTFANDDGGHAARTGQGHEAGNALPQARPRNFQSENGSSRGQRPQIACSHTSVAILL